MVEETVVKESLRDAAANPDQLGGFALMSRQVSLSAVSKADRCCRREQSGKWRAMKASSLFSAELIRTTPVTTNGQCCLVPNPNPA